MKAKNVAMLVRKDLRMSRGVFVAGLVMWTAAMLLSAIYGVAVGVPMGQAFNLHALRQMLGLLGTVTLILSVPMVVGHITAAEQVDRSGAFLAYIPHTRAEAVFGKMMCAILLTGALLGLCVVAVVIYAAYRAWGGTYIEWDKAPMYFRANVAEYMKWAVPAVVAVFGSAWLAGACLRNTTLATVMGIIMPILLWGHVLIHEYEAENQYSVLGWLPAWQHLNLHFEVWSVVLGVVFFVAGIVVFMKRRTEV